MKLCLACLLASMIYSAPYIGKPFAMAASFVCFVVATALAWREK